MTKLSKEEMKRQSQLPFDEQSEEFLRICAKHGNPCCVHGGRCDHTAQWLRLAHDVSRIVISYKGIEAKRFIQEFYYRAVLEIPWSTVCHFDLGQWAKEGSYAVKNKDKRRLIAGLDRAIAAGYVTFTPDADQQYKGIVAWNTSRIPKWGTPQPHKEDRVVKTIDQLVAEGKLSETWNQRLPTHEWRDIRSFVLERDDYTCQYCGQQKGAFHVDHVIPISRGGASHPDNLVTACETCNLVKHSRTPEEWLSQ